MNMFTGAGYNKHARNKKSVSGYEGHNGQGTEARFQNMYFFFKTSFSTSRPRLETDSRPIIKTACSRKYRPIIKRCGFQKIFHPHRKVRFPVFFMGIEGRFPWKSKIPISSLRSTSLLDYRDLSR